MPCKHNCAEPCQPSCDEDRMPVAMSAWIIVLLSLAAWLVVALVGTAVHTAGVMA